MPPTDRVPTGSDELTNRAARTVAALRARDTVGAIDVLGDVFEELLGVPAMDPVVGKPVPIWDRVRDLATRLERLERAHYADEELDHGGLPPVGAGMKGSPASQGPILVFPRPGTNRFELLNTIAGLPGVEWAEIPE